MIIGHVLHLSCVRTTAIKKVYKTLVTDLHELKQQLRTEWDN